MAIQEISVEEFDKHDPFRHPMASLTVEEVAWFADSKRNIIGAVARDKFDKDWSWVVMGRDPKGKFRAIDLQVSLPSESVAREQISSTMAALEASGKTVFKQD